MKESRFTEKKIIATLREAEAGAKVSELCGRNDISGAGFYNWKVRYVGTDISQLRPLKEIVAESARLGRMYADLSLTHHAPQEVVRKNRALSPRQRADLATEMVKECEISMRNARQAVGLPRSWFYAPAPPRDDRATIALIDGYIRENPRRGYDNKMWSINVRADALWNGRRFRSFNAL